MAHNTFDLEQEIEGEGKSSWTCKSHNFPECVGSGETDKDAINDMNRQLIYIKKNDVNRFKANIKYRIKNNLECMCGYKMDSEVVGVK